MDETDLLILSELLEDARKPFSTIADNIGSSTQTVKRRYHTLKKKYLLLSSISIDTSKLGFTGMADLLINAKSGTDLQDLLEPLKKMPGVIVVARTVGEFDCHCMMLVKDFHDFCDKIRTIQKLPNLAQLDLAIAENDQPQKPVNVNGLSLQIPT